MTRKELLLLKEKLIQELKYYEKRIEEAKLNETNNLVYDESSDSDSDPPVPFETGLSLNDLKTKLSALQTCFNATQELTGLQVLQSEVNVLVESPDLKSEPPVTEDGIWREVTVECRVDLVSFTMIFYFHQPYRKFGSPSFRCLHVAAVKKAHESELDKSILVHATTPSDAFEVLKSYAAAHRSRRMTLARLAAKFGELLYMTPLADGGYQLKCANLLEISWKLQNNTSPVAPFRHRMKFDLEYMDKSYLKTVTQAHKELSDPALETEERTMLLTKIIGTCLEARGINNTVQDSAESESEPVRVEKRRTSLDREPEMPVSKKKREDREVMAPPKTLPKKIKPKGKENNAENRMGEKTTKKSNSEIPNDASSKGKKPKISEKAIDSYANVNREKDNTKNVLNNVPKENTDKKSKKSEKVLATNTGDTEINAAVKASKVSNNIHKEVTNKENKVRNMNEDRKTNMEVVKQNKKKELNPATKQTSNEKQKGELHNRIKTDNVTNKNVEIVNTDNKLKTKSNTEAFEHKKKDLRPAAKQISSEKLKGETYKKIPDNVTKENAEVVATDNKLKVKSNVNLKAKEIDDKLINNNKIKSNKDAGTEKNHTKQSNNKEGNRINNHPESSNINKLKSSRNHPNGQLTSVRKSFNRLLKVHKMDNIRNTMILQKSTKIPQKKSLSAEKIMKKNPLRISPRKILSKLNAASSQESIRSTQSNFRKGNTNIPRLVKKSMTKTKS